MKIDSNRIPPEGVVLEENFDVSSLDLDTAVVSLVGPLAARAVASIITNAVTVQISLKGLMRMKCSRCLNEFEVSLEKQFQLNYTAEKTAPIIDLNPDIRQEIILDYPIKTLCKPDCKGLCPKCGKNLNEGVCSCQ